jgi:hypothetical protein
MAMTATEMIAFFGEQAEDAIYGISAAKKKQSFELAVLNVNEQFKCYLMQGLIQWRNQVDSPKAALLQAVENFVAGVELIESMRGSGAVAELCFERASIVAYLVGVAIDSPAGTELSSDRKLDSLIGNWLHTGELDQEYELHLASLSGEKLASQTYRAYFELMSGDGNSNDTVVTACKLFDQRKRDSFFSGGDQTEGGGSDNAFTVDYRLAALCKKINAPLDSVHRWRW